MNSRAYILIGGVIGLIAGLGLAFLLMSSLTTGMSVYTAFYIYLVVTLAILILSFVTLRNAHKSEAGISDSRSPKTRTTMLSAVIAVACIASSFMILRQIDRHAVEEQHEELLAQKQDAMIEAQEKSGLTELMGALITAIDDELKHRGDSTLSPGMIERIQGLNYAFDPYVQIEADTLNSQKLSSQRGLLLLSLVNMAIEPNTLEKIIRTTPFVGADLRGANLSGKNLSGIDLSGASLKDAILADVNFSGALLKKADLGRTDLTRANLSKSIMNSADLSWSKLDDAKLQSAMLDGVSLRSAKLNNSDLHKSSIKWANASGAVFKNSRVDSVNLAGTILTKALIQNVDLTGTNMWSTNLIDITLSQSDVTGVIFLKAIIPTSDWLEAAQTWDLSGAEVLTQNYIAIKDGNRYRVAHAE